MKANEAPEKVYIEPNLDSIWGMSERSCESEIEYVRKDAFIEKARTFLKDRIEHDSIDYPMATHWLIEDFINYMEDKKNEYSNG